MDKKYKVLFGCRTCDLSEHYHYNNFTDAVKMCNYLATNHFGHEDEFQQLLKITTEKIKWWE